MFARTFAPCLVAAALAATVGCDNAAIPSVIMPQAASGQHLVVQAQWQNPFPQGNDLNRMWGFPDGSFIAVGDAGTVLKYGGGAWTPLECGVRVDLHSVWGGSPNDVYVAGFAGTLLHYNGTTWTSISVPTTNDLYAVWLNSSDDLFVAGTGGTVHNRYNGMWTSYPVAPGRRLRSLLGYGHTEVYVCGSDATLFRFNGSAWTKVTPGVILQGDNEFLDLWGPGPGQFGFLSGHGLTWTDGLLWSTIPEANSYFPYGCWGVSLNNQVMVAAGLSTHLQDGNHVWYPTPTPEPLYDVWGPAKDDYFAVGRSGNIAHFNGSGWQALNEGPTNDLRDLFVSPAGAVAVGAEGTILRQTDTQWISESVDSRYDLAGVWQSGGTTITVGRFAPDGRAWRQAILTKNGGVWTDPGVIGTAQRLYDVWGSGPNDAYTVGWAGEILHYDGNAWSVTETGNGDAAFLKSVSGTDPDNVIAVGRTNDLRGLVCRFDGQNWIKTVFYGVEELCGVWVSDENEAYAVGNRGEIRHLSGSNWLSVDSPTNKPLFAVWGTSESDVYVAGLEGTVFRFDGRRWDELLPPTNRSFYSVMGRSASELYLAGERGTILLLGKTAPRPRRHEPQIFSSM